jgi:hypothetical protein
MIKATNKGGSNYEPIAAGTYAARCYQMIHIGTAEENILGQVKKLNKVRITWELPTETKVFKEENGEQPHVISKEFTLSMNEKATLRKFLEGWRGKSFTEKEAESFDITVLLGKPCMLSIIHKQAKNGNTYAEISSVSSVPKGMNVPDQINPLKELNYDKFDWDLFETLPDFIKDKMKQTDEFKFMMQPHETSMKASIEMDNDLDLPF